MVAPWAARGAVRRAAAAAAGGSAGSGEAVAAAVLALGRGRAGLRVAVREAGADGRDGRAQGLATVRRSPMVGLRHRVSPAR